MLTKALILTDGEADMLNRVLEEVKTKVYKQSETSLDATQALDALVTVI
ncbi:MAG TPA: hypothetical protein VEF35_01755 [Candidatus Bathyarchaeia archaeon]|nr:hypothetical protein [Candidatus Bathyarchaeia archaeon]